MKGVMWEAAAVERARMRSYEDVSKFRVEEERLREQAEIRKRLLGGRGEISGTERRDMLGVGGGNASEKRVTYAEIGEAPSVVGMAFVALIGMLGAVLWRSGERLSGGLGIVIAILVTLGWLLSVRATRRLVKRAKIAAYELTSEQLRLFGLPDTLKRGVSSEFVTNKGELVGELDRQLAPLVQQNRRKPVKVSKDGALQLGPGGSPPLPRRWDLGYGDEIIEAFEADLSSSEEELSPEDSQWDLAMGMPRVLSPAYDTSSPQNYHGRGVSKSPSPLPAAPQTYRPSPKERTKLRAKDFPDLWQTEDEEREALASLGVSESLWHLGPDAMREWLSERLIAPLVKLCDESSMRVTVSLYSIMTQAEWKTKYGIVLPLAPLGSGGAAGRGADGNDGGPGSSGSKTSPEPTKAGLLMGSSVGDLDIMLSGIKTILQQQIQQVSPYGPTRPQGSMKEALHNVSTHLHLLSLLRGEYPQHLLAPVPPAYMMDRIRELSVGSCCTEFLWDGGGNFGERRWSAELPTDTHLFLYLFCAYVQSYGWSFPQDPATGADLPSGIQGSLFVGELPMTSRGRGPYTAILPTRPREPPHEAFIISCSPVTSPPQICIMEGDKQHLLLCGHAAALRTLLLVLHRAKSVHGGALGLGINIGSPLVGLLDLLDCF